MSKKSWYHEFFVRLSFVQWAFVAVSIVTLILNVGMFAYNGAISAATYFVFVVTVTVGVIVDKINFFKINNETMIKLEQITAFEAELHCIGDTVDGAKAFIKNSYGLKAVSNTVFYRTATQYNRHLNEKMPEYEDRIVKVISEQPVFWRDIVTSDQVDLIKNFRNRLPSEHDHQFVEWKSDAPLLQMQILNFIDPREQPIVLFGWGFNGGAESMVFRSNHPKTVAYFQDYFNKLYSFLEHGSNQNQDLTVVGNLPLPTLELPTKPRAIRRLFGLNISTLSK